MWMDMGGISCQFEAKEKDCGCNNIWLDRKQALMLLPRCLPPVPSAHARARPVCAAPTSPALHHRHITRLQVANQGLISQPDLTPEEGVMESAVEDGERIVSGSSASTSSSTPTGRGQGTRLASIYKWPRRRPVPVRPPFLQKYPAKDDGKRYNINRWVH